MIGANPQSQQDYSANVLGGAGDGTSTQGTATAGTTSQPTTPQSTHTQESYILALQQKLAMMTEIAASGPGSDSGTPQPDQAQITLGSSVGGGTGGTATPKDSSSTGGDAKHKVRPAAMDFQDLEAELHKIHTINKSGPQQQQSLPQGQPPNVPPGMSAVTVGMNLAAAAAQFAPGQLHAQQMHGPTLLTTYVPAQYQHYQSFVAPPHMAPPQGSSMDISGQQGADPSQQAGMPHPGSNPQFLHHQPQLIQGHLGPMIHHPGGGVGISSMPNYQGSPFQGHPQYSPSPHQHQARGNLLCI